MIKGIFILQVKNEKEWKVHAEYIPLAEERPTPENLGTIAAAFLASPTLTSFNVRFFPYKYYTIAISGTEESPKYYLTFILEATETLELVKIFPNELKKGIIDMLSNAAGLKAYMQKIMEDRNLLLDKLEKPKLLQDQIGARANKLIDAGQFKEAQDTIKMAKDVPGELVSAYKAGLKEFKANNFKQAEKRWMEAFQLTEKSGDKELLEYIGLKIETARQIPSFQKELKSLLNNMIKTLGKSVNYLPYNDQLNGARRIYELFDTLENDDKMTQIAELQTILQDSAQLMQQMQSLDTRIKKIIGQFSVE